MRPLFTKHVSHPVRSRFSAFSWTKASTRGSQRLSDEEANNLDSTLQNSSDKTLTTNPLPPGASKYNNLKTSEDLFQTTKTEDLELDVIQRHTPKLSTAAKPSAWEGLDKGKRRKEYWEVVEDKELEEIKEARRRDRMDPAKWELRKKEWERIERMNSKLRKDYNHEAKFSPARPYPTSDDTWYNGWGNRLGNGDGNQGWELELGPSAGGVELPPTVHPDRHAHLRSQVGVEEFGRF